MMKQCQIMLLRDKRILDEELQSIDKFFEDELSVVFCTKEELELLRKQAAAMTVLSNVIQERINLFPDEALKEIKKPHQQRVIEEKMDLDTKIGKLDQFIGKNEVFKELDLTEKLRMIKQLNIMREYSALLKEQIDTFS